MKFEKVRVIQEEAAKKEGRRRRLLRCKCLKGKCGYFQVAVTFLGLGSCAAGLYCAIVLTTNLDRLGANYVEAPSNEDLPCARKPLPVCDASAMDECKDECCPTGYMCIRDTTVGIYCQNREWICGRYDFCVGIADMPGTCEKDSCKERKTVERMAFGVFVMASSAAILDLFDMLLCFSCADNVLYKSVTNLLAFLIKLLAFSCVFGVGTEGYLTELIDASCYNQKGYATSQEAQQAFKGVGAALFCSAACSFCLAPVSALKGGRLRDEPNYRLKAIEIGA